VPTAIDKVQDTITACSKPWYKGDANTPERLEEILKERQPKTVFFLFWNWKVPDRITDKYECINFHMTDLPYGRGGSPLQNLILRGHKTTKLTMHRMTKEIDSGEVLMKKEMSLSGGAEEIYLRAVRLAEEMMGKFRRRTPADSKIPNGLSLEALHDFIRMLDAETYPKAFIEYGGYRIEFKRSALYNGRVEADVIITEGDNEHTCCGGAPGR